MNENENCSKLLVQRPGYTKRPLFHQAAYQTLFKILIRKKLKKTCKNLKSLKIQAIKLNKVIDFFEHKKFKNKLEFFKLM